MRLAKMTAAGSLHRSLLSTAAAAMDEYAEPHTPSNNQQKHPIYVAATRQHVGKTSVSLALMSGLQKRFHKHRVGFMKPVGQKCVSVSDNHNNSTILVDKDVVVMKQHFQLNHLSYQHMSPMIIPPKYTRDYLDGKSSMSLVQQEQIIQEAYHIISSHSDVVLLEGTGHVGVGSIVGVSNASVAKLLHASMVLVANGGLGSAFDELELNRNLCEMYNVPIAGVVINKIQPDKYQQTQEYIQKALQMHWNDDTPLLGCIPDRPYLGCPALADLEQLFGTSLWSGATHRLRHYTMKDLNLVSTSLGVFLENLREKPSRTLYVCHVSREDIILGFLAEYQRRIHLQQNVGDDNEAPFEAALIVCGKSNKFKLNPQILDMIACHDGDNKGPPILAAPFMSNVVMEMIHKHTPKLNVDDAHRVNTTIQHYEPFIDFDLLLERTGNTPASSTRQEELG